MCPRMAMENENGVYFEPRPGILYHGVYNCTRTIHHFGPAYVHFLCFKVIMFGDFNPYCPIWEGL